MIFVITVTDDTHTRLPWQAVLSGLDRNYLGTGDTPRRAVLDVLAARGLDDTVFGGADDG